MIKIYLGLGGVAMVADSVLFTVIHGVMVLNKVSTVKKTFLNWTGYILLITDPPHDM